MKLSLVNRVGEFTKNLKKNEEEYMKKYKELVGDTFQDDAINSRSNFDLNNSVHNGSSFLQTNRNDILQKRDKEITILVDSINELASIFKDMQALVLEQGTILDRIDYNIDNALHDTKIATIALVEADKNTKNNCSRNANMALMVLIFIMSIILLFKIL
jgi:syntaxin 16